MNEEEKYNRQVLWFGSDGQAKLAGLKVAIVGIGGTGSHVLQQLVYLGVKSYFRGWKLGRADVYKGD